MAGTVSRRSRSRLAPRLWVGAWVLLAALAAGSSSDTSSSLECARGCVVEQDFVCGADRNTYQSRCLAVCQGVPVVASGPCPDLSEAQARNSLDQHLPRASHLHRLLLDSGDKDQHASDIHDREARVERGERRRLKQTRGTAPRVLKASDMQAFSSEGFALLGTIKFVSQLGGDGALQPQSSASQEEDDSQAVAHAKVAALDWLTSSSQGEVAATQPAGSSSVVRALRVTRGGLLYAATYDLDVLAETIRQAGRHVPGSPPPSTQHQRQKAAKAAYSRYGFLWEQQQQQGSLSAPPWGQLEVLRWMQDHGLPDTPFYNPEAAAEQQGGGSSATHQLLIRRLMKATNSSATAARRPPPSKCKHAGSPPKHAGSPPKQTGSPPKQAGSPPKHTDSKPKQAGSKPKQAGLLPKEMGSPPKQVGLPPPLPAPSAALIAAALPQCPVRKFPFTTVGQLQLTDATGARVCTGTLVSADAVLTAGHCVFMRDGNGGGAFYQELDFAAGRYRHRGAARPVDPFGLAPWAYVTIFDNFMLVGERYKFDWDVAVIRLATPVGKDAGWLGIASGCATHAATGAPATTYRVATAGFPVALPFGTCTSTNCSITSDTCARSAYHTCPSLDGESGSPFYLGSDYRVRGILVGTQAAFPLPLKVTHLVGTSSYSALLQWILEPTVPQTPDDGSTTAWASPPLDPGASSPPTTPPSHANASAGNSSSSTPTPPLANRDAVGKVNLTVVTQGQQAWGAGNASSAAAPLTPSPSPAGVAVLAPLSVPKNHHRKRWRLKSALPPPPSPPQPSSGRPHDWRMLLGQWLLEAVWWQRPGVSKDQLPEAAATIVVHGGPAARGAALAARQMDRAEALGQGHRQGAQAGEHDEAQEALSQQPDTMAAGQVVLGPSRGVA